MQEPTLSPSKKSRRSKVQWQSLIKEFQSEESTIAEFCQKRQICASGFYQWRKKLTVASDKEDPSPLFVQMQPSTLASPVSNTPLWDVELELGSSMILRIRRSC